MLIVGIKYPKQIKRIIKRIVLWEYFTNRDSSCEQCDTLFQDGVLEHEKAYQVEGIKPKKDFEALQKSMKLVSKTDQLSVVGLVLLDNNNKQISSVVIPDTAHYEKVIQDSVHFLSTEKDFAVNGVQGKVFISISRAKLNKDVSSINRPIFLFLTFIAAVIMILVYVLANLISTQLLV